MYTYFKIYCSFIVYKIFYELFLDLRLISYC